MAGLISIKRLLSVAGIVGTGVAAGRAYLRGQVEGKKLTAIEAARDAAEAELDREISDVVSEKLKDFVLLTLFKAAIVGGLFILFAIEELTSRGLRLGVTTLVAAYLMRDIWRSAPLAWRGLIHLRRNGWSIRRAVTEFVGTMAFEKALSQAQATLKQGGARQSIIFALSGHKSDAVSREIAAAVEEVVRSTAYTKIRLRVLVALGHAVWLSVFYAGLVWLALRS